MMILAQFVSARRISFQTAGLLAALSILWSAQVTAASSLAANVNMIRGSATASSDDGSIRALALGDAVHSGEIISTGPNSQVNLKFVDKAFVLVRANSRFVIEDYAFEEEEAEAEAQPQPEEEVQPERAVEAAEAAAPASSADSKPRTLAERVRKNAAPEQAKNDDKKVSGRDLASATRSIRRARATSSRSASSGSRRSRGFFRLIKGGFRAVTGLIAQRYQEDYRVNTPVATIGVRGTDYGATICDAACAADPVIRDALTEGAIAEGGLIVSVFSGTIVIGSGDSDCNGPCEVSAPRYVLVTADGTQIVLEQAPQFLQVDPTPDPASCGA